MMSEKDGFQLYDRLKKVHPHLKICFLTASEMHHQELRGVKHCTKHGSIYSKANTDWRSNKGNKHEDKLNFLIKQ